jgi:hypothetical protein
MEWVIAFLSSILIAASIIIWSRTLTVGQQRIIALILFVLGCIAVALGLRGTP